MWNVAIGEKAKEDIEKHQKAGDKQLIKKIERLLVELKNNPYANIAHREFLKYGLTGRESCRINDKHRMVFYLDETRKTVFIVSLYGHY